MKIGILTYHRSHNYGALLQAVATRLVLQKMGHEVYYIDYYPPYHQRLYKIFSWYNFWHANCRVKLFLIHHLIKEYPYLKKRYNNFILFKEKEIYPYCKPLNEKYNVIVYGSDQIWRVQKALNDFNPIYFGASKELAKRHISYAASMGIENLNDEQKYKLKNLVSNLDAISVRETSLKLLLESLGINNVQQTIDPTLLLSEDEWNHEFPTKKKHNQQYVLIYDLLNGSFDHEAISKFAVEQNLAVFEIVGAANIKNTDSIRSTDGPFEFIDLIRNAKYVFTSSFHGLAFSLIFGKQFYASFIRNPGRAESLLEKLGLQDHYLIVGSSQIPILEDIDYSRVRSLLEKEKQSSLAFIRKNCI